MNITSIDLLSHDLVALPSLVERNNNSSRLCWLFLLSLPLISYPRLHTLGLSLSSKSSIKPTLSVIEKAIIWHGVPAYSILYCRTSSGSIRELHLLQQLLSKNIISVFSIITVSFSRTAQNNFGVIHIFGRSPKNWEAAYRAAWLCSWYFTNLNITLETP